MPLPPAPPHRVCGAADALLSAGSLCEGQTLAGDTSSHPFSQHYLSDSQVLYKLLGIQREQDGRVCPERLRADRAAASRLSALRGRAGGSHGVGRPGRLNQLGLGKRMGMESIWATGRTSAVWRWTRVSRILRLGQEGLSQSLGAGPGQLRL